MPFNQGIPLSGRMARRGIAHEVYAYQGRKNCFSTSADNETTQQLWQDLLNCLRR